MSINSIYSNRWAPTAIVFQGLCVAVCLPDEV